MSFCGVIVLFYIDYKSDNENEIQVQVQNEDEKSVGLLSSNSAIILRPKKQIAKHERRGEQLGIFSSIYSFPYVINYLIL